MNNYFYSKQNQQKVSFGGLKMDSSFGSVTNNQNKENEKRFQNLKKDQGRQISKKGQSRQKTIEDLSWCIYHSNKQVEPKNYIQATYQDKDSGCKLCDHCSVRFATQGYKILKIIKDSTKGHQKIMHSSFEETFNQHQASLKNYIENYNNKFSEIIEILTDMQIKDLMKFNSVLEKNVKIYQAYSYESKMPKFISLNGQEMEKLSTIQKYLQKVAISPLISFDCRSTVDSKTNKSKINSDNSSTVSPRLSKKKQSFETENMQKSLQDTPESVKSKLSEVSSKIKLKNTKIGMFDRINICQSIQEGLIPMGTSNKTENGPQIKYHRYSRNSEQ